MERTIRILLDGQLIEKFDCDFDDDLSETEIIESVCSYVFENIDIEVI